MDKVSIMGRSSSPLKLNLKFMVRIRAAREQIQYFCNYCLDLFDQYEKYYCFVLKFLIILELHRRATVSKSLINKSLKLK